MKAKIFFGPGSSGKTRTAKLISEFIGTQKTTIIDGYRFNYSIQQVPDNTELLIVDTLPNDFEFEQFYTTINDNGEIKFCVKTAEKFQSPKILHIPYLILCANTIQHLDRYRESQYFNDVFDIVEFPLSDPRGIFQ